MLGIIRNAVHVIGGWFKFSSPNLQVVIDSFLASYKLHTPCCYKGYGKATKVCLMLWPFGFNGVSFQNI